jgi:tetratricopeptide (TPR) repeat protein
VFGYKGTTLSPQQIAAELHVQALIYGRVARRAGQLTIYLSMVDGRTGNQLWGEQYSGAIDALPALERQIAEGVARGLQVDRSGRSAVPLTPGYTPTNDAYLLYLRGQFHRFRSNDADLQTAIDFYTRAIEADPTYAPAHAGLAEAYRARSIVGPVSSMEAFPRARNAAMRALELDDRLIEAHIALGWIRFSFDWDWAGAERELQRAIELNPENADAHRAYAHLLSNQGRHGEALLEAARARELDPRSLISNALEGQFLFYAGKHEAAAARLRRTLGIEPRYWVAHQGLGRVHLLRDRLEDAVAALRMAVDLSGRATEPMMQLGYALARSGRRDEARTLLRELEARSSERYVPAYAFAMVHNGLGEADAALRRLEQSVDQREVQATFIKIDSRWDPLRADPRFVALLERMNLT